MKSSHFTVGLIVAGIYLWLGYSMNILKNPLIAMAIYYPLFCIAGGALIWRFSKPDINQTACTLKTSPLLITSLLSILATIVIWGLSKLLIAPGYLEPEFLTSSLENSNIHRENFWQAGLIVAIVNPVSEEFFWRRGIYSYISRIRGRYAGMIGSSLLFAGYHPLSVYQYFPGVWALAVGIIVFAGGVILTNLYERSKSIFWPIILHAVINCNLMIIGFLYAPSSTS